MDKQEIKDYLIEVAEYSEARVNSMSPYQLVNAYLRYEGIIGYTDLILGIIGAAYDIKFNDNGVEV